MTCVTSSGESVSLSTGPTCTSCTMSTSLLRTTRMSPWSLSSPWTGTADGPRPPCSPLTAAHPLIKWRRERCPPRLSTWKPDVIGPVSHPHPSTENQGLLYFGAGGDFEDGEKGCFWEMELSSDYLEERRCVIGKHIGRSHSRHWKAIAVSFLPRVSMQQTSTELLSGGTDMTLALAWLTI